MKKFLIPSLVIMLALLIAVPSFALEVKWGGLFRARVISQDGFAGSPSAGDGDYGYPAVSLGAPQKSTAQSAGASGGTNGGILYTPYLNRIDQRLRVYMDFISSENLKVVARFETQAYWGRTNELNTSTGTGAGAVGGGTIGVMNYGSGNVGADSGYLTVKNAYVDFNVPGTPLNAKVGIQGIALLDSWIIDSDFSGALLTADLKPFTVILGYVAGQNFNFRQESDNIDDLTAVVAYKQGPFSASLVGFWQDAHNVPASVFPTIAGFFDDPLQQDVQFSSSFNGGANYLYPYNPNPAIPLYVTAQNNQLFDLGFQLGYKMDYLNLYLNFVKNFGSVKVGLVRTATTVPTPTSVITPPGEFNANYTGWMVDAGGTWFCGPWTLNLGGFYTAGQKLDFVATDPTKPISATNQQVIAPDGKNISQMTYPLSTSKYFSEIIGGGILDNFAPNGGYWRGYPDPTNLWTVTLGTAWQVLPQTKLSLSAWHFATSNKVPSKFNANTGTWSTSSNVGNEFDFYITQNIVDKLNLDIVAAYMLTGGAFDARTTTLANGASQSNTGPSNAYELGARFQWAW